MIFGAVLLWLFVPGFKEKLGAFAFPALGLTVAAVVGAIGVMVWRRQRRPAPAAVLIPPRISFPPAPNLTLKSKRPQLPWTLELLRSLDWKVFEDLVAAFAKHVGHVGKTTRLGADGWIDVHIYEPGNPRPVMVVQCKAWETRQVGVSPIRELYGVMAAEQIKEGAFFTTGTFTPDALEFARGKALDLVDGVEFLARIHQLPLAAQGDLLGFATAGDYTTPTCPTCGVKMVFRVAAKGVHAGSRFWGCRSYPQCKRTFPFKPLQEGV